LQPPGIIRTLEVHDPAENAGINQGGELALEAGRAHVEVFGEITEIPPSIGMKHRGCQERLACPRKEGIKYTFRTLLSGIRVIFRATPAR